MCVNGGRFIFLECSELGVPILEWGENRKEGPTQITVLKEVDIEATQQCPHWKTDGGWSPR